MKNTKRLSELEKEIDADVEKNIGVITDGYCEDEESQNKFDKKQKGNKPVTE